MKKMRQVHYKKTTGRGLAEKRAKAQAKLERGLEVEPVISRYDADLAARNQELLQIDTSQDEERQLETLLGAEAGDADADAAFEERIRLGLQEGTLSPEQVTILRQRRAAIQKDSSLMLRAEQQRAQLARQAQELEDARARAANIQTTRVARTLETLHRVNTRGFRTLHEAVDGVRDSVDAGAQETAARIEDAKQAAREDAAQLADTIKEAERTQEELQILLAEAKRDRDNDTAELLNRQLLDLGAQIEFSRQTAAKDAEIALEQRQQIHEEQMAQKEVPQPQPQRSPHASRILDALSAEAAASPPEGEIGEILGGLGSVMETLPIDKRVADKTLQQVTLQQVAGGMKSAQDRMKNLMSAKLLQFDDAMNPTLNGKSVSLVELRNFLNSTNSKMINSLPKNILDAAETIPAPELEKIGFGKSVVEAIQSRLKAASEIGAIADVLTTDAGRRRLGHLISEGFIRRVGDKYLHKDGEEATHDQLRAIVEGKTSGRILTAMATASPAFGRLIRMLASSDDDRRKELTSISMRSMSATGKGLEPRRKNKTKRDRLSAKSTLEQRLELAQGLMDLAAVDAVAARDELHRAFHIKHRLDPQNFALLASHIRGEHQQQELERKKRGERLYGRLFMSRYPNQLREKLGASYLERME